MPDIDVRLDIGELDLKVSSHIERSYGDVLDIEFARRFTVNGSPDGFREFAQELSDLVNAECPGPSQVYEGFTLGELIEAATAELYRIQLPHLAEAVEGLYADHVSGLGETEQP